MEGPTVALSLNEAEALAAKAARGAGLSWGEAEDLGRAARWLAASGLDWATPLLGLLHSPEERAGLKGLFRAADRLARAPGHGPAGFCRPAWGLAVLAATAPDDTSLSLCGPDFRVRLSPGGLASTDQDPFALAHAPPAEILVDASAGTPPLARLLAPNTRRSAVPAAQMGELGDLAARTYVPASEESRRLGAGGGRIDDP